MLKTVHHIHHKTDVRQFHCRENFPGRWVSPTLTGRAQITSAVRIIVYLRSSCSSTVSTWFIDNRHACYRCEGSGVFRISQGGDSNPPSLPLLPSLPPFKHTSRTRSRRILLPGSTAVKSVVIL